MALSFGYHGRPSPTRWMALSASGAVPGAGRGQPLLCLAQLERGSGATHRRSCRHLGRASDDRWYVVRGHAVEAAVAGFGGPEILDRPGGDAGGVCVASRTRRACVHSQSTPNRAGGVSCGADLCSLVDPGIGSKARQCHRHRLCAAAMAWHLSARPAGGMAVVLHIPGDGNVLLRAMLGCAVTCPLCAMPRDLGASYSLSPAEGGG